MTTHAFQLKPLKRRGIIHKLLKKQPRSNFVIEINNLLATKHISDVTTEDIISIMGKYRSGFSNKVLQGLHNLYSDYLVYCLEDKMLSDEEINNLNHLKEILGINDPEIKALHNAITGAIYRKSVHEAVQDGEVSPEEKTFLVSLYKNLALSDELAEKITTEVKGAFVQEYLRNAIADQRLSPQEEEQLQAICRNLNVDLALTEGTKKQLAKYKLLWSIENGDIPQVNVSISLGKQEVCYFYASTDWYELRTVTQRINYAGTTASIKIMKGVHYRVGSIKPQRITSQELKHIDTGMLYITNKRLIFTGKIKNTTINLTKILSFTPYSDGVEISKSAGRSPFLKFSSDTDVFNLILSRLLNG